MAKTGRPRKGQIALQQQTSIEDNQQNIPMEQPTETPNVQVPPAQNEVVSQQPTTTSEQTQQPTEIPLPTNETDNSGIIAKLGNVDADKVGDSPNIFEGERILRDYSKVTPNNKTESDFVEPNFDIPTDFPKKNINQQSSIEKVIAEQGSESGKNPFNDSSDNKTPLQGQQSVADVNAEAEAGAIQMVSVFWSMYNKLNMVCSFLAKIDEEDLMQRAAKGEIDLQIKFELPRQGELTASDYFKYYNQTVAETFVANPKLEKETRDAMIRLCKKHNLVMSDEWFVLMKIGEDVVMKGGSVLMLRKTSRSVLEQLIELGNEKKKIEIEERKKHTEEYQQSMANQYKNQFKDELEQYFTTKKDSLRKEWESEAYHNIKTQVLFDLEKAAIKENQKEVEVKKDEPTPSEDISNKSTKVFKAKDKK